MAMVDISNADLDPKTLVGAWLFDKAGGDIARDSSGNGHDGQVKGTVRVPGKFLNALEFDGDDFVEVVDADDLRLSKQFSMLVWFFAEDVNSWRQLIAKDNEYLLRIDPPGEGNNMSAFVNVGGWEPRASASVPELETWTHFAATYDGNELKVYVNGVLSGQSSRLGKPQSTDNPVEFGRWGGALLGDDVGYFVGIIDEIAIFNAVLTEDELQILMEAGLLEALDLSVLPLGKLATLWGVLKRITN